MKRIRFLIIVQKRLMRTDNSGIKEQRYVDLLMDSGFKAVFGDERNKDVVIDFLNAVLEGEHHVVSIEYLNNEVLGEPSSSKGVRFDLHCIDDLGVRFVVEMQRARHSDDFFERSIYYGSRLYTLQQLKGEKSYHMKPVYVIGIMEGNLSHMRPDAGYVARFSMQESDALYIAPKTISCIFVQLGFFDKKAEECICIIDQWCFSLKNMGGLEEQPQDFDETSFSNLFRASEIAQFDETKRINYDTERMTERDYQHDLYFSRKEGREEGREEGLKQGRDEAKLEDAKNLKELGVSVDVIAKATGLSIEVIEALQ